MTIELSQCKGGQASLPDEMTQPRYQERTEDRKNWGRKKYVSVENMASLRKVARTAGPTQNESNLK